VKTLPVLFVVENAVTSNSTIEQKSAGAVTGPIGIAVAMRQAASGYALRVSPRSERLTLNLMRLEHKWRRHTGGDNSLRGGL